MARKTKKGKDRLDKFYQLAKEQGYRSRAAFKLIQLNKKYGFLENATAIVDLCAAPGGWLQVARKFAPVAATIVGVDLAPIKAIPYVKTFTGDITTVRCTRDLKTELGSKPADLVLHDGAPNVGANWSRDAFTQSELVLSATKIASQVLAHKGTFLTKVFRSADYNSLLWVFNQLFDKVEATKPVASRNASAEIYVICTGYRNPKEIDPKLFNPKTVFALIENSEGKLDRAKLRLTQKDLRKRNREGYEEGDLILFKSVPVRQFIETEKPVGILAAYNKLDFNDPDSQMFLEHPDTTEEIKILCSDLKLMGRIDFKRLLKWRDLMRKHLFDTQKQEMGSDIGSEDEDAMADDQGSDEMEEDDEKDEEDEDETLDPEERKRKKRIIETEKLIEELHDLKVESLKAKKRTIRKAKRKLSKQMPRFDEMVENPHDVLDTFQGDDLFSIRSIKTAGDLTAVLEKTDKLPPRDPDEGGAPERMRQAKLSMTADAYDKFLENEFDQMYADFMQTRKQRDADTLQEDKNDVDPNLYRTFVESTLGDRDTDGDDDDAPQDANPLTVDFQDKKQTPKATADMWFSQPMFSMLSQQAKQSSSSTASTNPAKRRKTSENTFQKTDSKTEQIRKAYDSDGDDDDDSSDDDSSDDDALSSGDDDDEGMKNGSEKTVTHPALSDPQQAAVTLAIGQKMLRKKDRMDIFDQAFNRYVFNDDVVKLPDWFVEDETRHNKPQLPVSKEEIEEMKKRWQEINERPIRKVLEAKFRKKRRAAARLEKMQHKAAVISDSQELNNTEKLKELQKLYKKALTSGKDKKKDKVYVVSKKGGGSGAAKGGNKSKRGKVTRVDPRLKKDKRGKAKAMRSKKK